MKTTPTHFPPPEAVEPEAAHGDTISDRRPMNSLDVSRALDALGTPAHPFPALELEDVRQPQEPLPEKPVPANQVTQNPIIIDDAHFALAEIFRAERYEGNDHDTAAYQSKIDAFFASLDLPGPYCQLRGETVGRYKDRMLRLHAPESNTRLKGESVASYQRRRNAVFASIIFPHAFVNVLDAVQAFRSALDYAESKRLGLVSSLGSTKGELDKLNEELRKTDALVREMTEQYGPALAAKAAAEKKAAEAEVKAGAAEEKAGIAEGKLGPLENRAGAAEERASTAEAKASELAAKLEKASAANAAVESLQAELHREAVRADGAEERLRDAEKKAEGLLKKASDHAKKVEGRAGGLESRAKAAESQLAQMTERAREAETQVGRLKEELRTQPARIETIGAIFRWTRIVLILSLLGGVGYVGYIKGDYLSDKWEEFKQWLDGQPGPLHRQQPEYREPPRSRPVVNDPASSGGGASPLREPKKPAAAPPVPELPSATDTATPDPQPPTSENSDTNAIENQLETNLRKVVDVQIINWKKPKSKRSRSIPAAMIDDGLLVTSATYFPHGSIDVQNLSYLDSDGVPKSLKLNANKSMWYCFGSFAFIEIPKSSAASLHPNILTTQSEIPPDSTSFSFMARTPTGASTAGKVTGRRVSDHGDHDVFDMVLPEPIKVSDHGGSPVFDSDGRLVGMAIHGPADPDSSVLVTVKRFSPDFLTYYRGRKAEFLRSGK